MGALYESAVVEYWLATELGLFQEYSKNSVYGK